MRSLFLKPKHCFSKAGEKKKISRWERGLLTVIMMEIKQLTKKKKKKGQTM